jgi:hypothetical protein
LVLLLINDLPGFTKRGKLVAMHGHIADKPDNKPVRKQPDGKYRKAPDDTQQADGTDRNGEHCNRTVRQQIQ